jgi:exopolysaccharide biosynthesis protein
VQDPPPPKRRRVKRIVLAAVAVVVLAAGGGAYWALDRFVIDHVQISDVRAYEASVSSSATTAAASSGTTTITDGSTSSAADSAAAVVSDTSYTSDDASVTISTVVTGSGDSTVTYYVADVTLTDATVLRSAFANNEFGQNITEDTSDIAADNDAIFAINGDYYGFRDTGIVIRNGVVFRDEGARQGLAFYTDGTVKVYDETTTTADQLVADGVWNTLSFGPAVVENGEIVDGIDSVEVDTNVGNHSIQGEQPRTAVGIIDANHLVFVVVDGRSPGYSAGVTMTGLAEIMQSLGAQTAYNLDGGGSSTMYFNGAVVNDPLGNGEERGVSDILYIGG